jgi:hypothetical protein
MVGDYISTSWLAGRAFGAFAVANPPSGGFAFDQALYVPSGGLTAAAASTAAGSSAQAVPGAASDHAAAHSAIRRR